MKPPNQEDPLARPKRKKVPSTTKDYILMRMPEDEGLFAVVREARDHERYTFIPTEKEIEAGHKIPSYDRMIYVISPFLNHLTGEEGIPSCNCTHWMTQKTRCIHLKKFFELNPDLDPENSKCDTGSSPPTSTPDAAPEA